MILFIANDPGGFDVIKPVFDFYHTNDKRQVLLLLTGASKEKEERYAYTDEAAIKKVKQCIESGVLEVLVTGTSWGGTVEVQAINLCKSYKIKTIAILDYWSNYKKRFLFKGKYIFPDYLFVPDEYAQEDSILDGVPEEIIRIVGHPGFDSLVKRTQPYSDANKALFLSQPLSVIYGMKLGFNEMTTFPMVISACKKAGFRLNVKFHPKETERFRKKYKQFERTGNISDVLSDYKVVIGMNTMGLLQTVLVGMPVISFEPDMVGNDLCITNKLGITRPAVNEDELTERLDNIEAINIDRDKYLWMDGMSTRRCVNEISRVLLNP